MRRVVFALAIPLLAFCYDHIPPETAKERFPTPPTGPAPILETLKGILFLSDWNMVRKEAIDEIEGVRSVGVELLEKAKDFLFQLQLEFVGKPLTPESMQAIKLRVSEYYEAKNQPLVVVSTPKQEVTKGVLQVVVTEAKLGEIRCKGNRYFMSDQLKDYIRAKPGETISSQELMQDLAFMNESPFRRTDALFTPGAKPGIADLELLTVDRWPYRVYAGADNTGTVPSQRNRLFFGVNLGKTIVPDSEVSYQYTTAPSGNRYYSHSAMVRAPLPWFRHTATAHGGYAKVNPDSGTPGVKPMGISWEVDLRYRIPIFNRLDALQEAILGYDFKESNTKLTNSGKKAYYAVADINQVLFGYNLGIRNRMRKIALNVELYVSPGHWTNHDNNSSYHKLRYDANCRYAYLKVVHSLSQEIESGWRFSYNFSGQVSSTNLLPSEQFTLTGYNGVRGFLERVLNVDNAALLNLTLETPHFSPAHWMGWSKHYDELYFTAFFDSGIGGNCHPVPGESGFQTLGSIGPSFRYELSRYASVHLDYGFQLWHSGFKPEGNSQYNFGVILSY